VQAEERKARTEKEVRHLLGHVTPEALEQAAVEIEEGGQPPSKRARTEEHGASR
jgi:hypothetical protein